MSWLFTLDHKRIGVMYLVSVIWPSSWAASSRCSCASSCSTPGAPSWMRSTYNRCSRCTARSWCSSSSSRRCPAALGNFVLPIMLGAKDVAFPRLNLMSFYIYVIGPSSLLISIVSGAVDTGWTFYTPYSTSTRRAWCR
jgi:cytochrome c oxidase subunit 1